ARTRTGNLEAERDFDRPFILAGADDHGGVPEPRQRLRADWRGKKDEGEGGDARQDDAFRVHLTTPLAKQKDPGALCGSFPGLLPAVLDRARTPTRPILTRRETGRRTLRPDNTSSGNSGRCSCLHCYR